MAKRKHKVRKKKPKPVKRTHKLWPVIWCTGEDICIGVSHVSVGLKYTGAGKPKAKSKVSHDQWRSWNSVFRDGYSVDFTGVKVGDTMYCSHCQAKVDFRLFPSMKPPELCDVRKVED